MSGLKRSGLELKLNDGPRITTPLTEEALDLVAEIKLKSEDLTQVANLLLLTSKVVNDGVPGILGEKIKAGTEDLYIICEAQFKVMAHELSELLSKTWM
jgi:hypothetical protein